jgi:hypothetical protein
LFFSQSLKGELRIEDMYLHDQRYFSGEDEGFGDEIEVLEAVLCLHSGNVSMH